MSVESNRLGQETSPYLLQHQHNPVHWQAWSAETLASPSRPEDPYCSRSLRCVSLVPCDGHESFEDAEIAALMNEYLSM